MIHQFFILRPRLSRLPNTLFWILKISLTHIFINTKKWAVNSGLLII